MVQIIIMRPGVEAQVKKAFLPAKPNFSTLKVLLRTLLDGGDLERVNVLHDGKYTDMFVDETSALKGLPLNPEATAIYRNNWLTNNPGSKAEDLPAICGPAVLFSEKVWF